MTPTTDTDKSTLLLKQGCANRSRTIQTQQFLLSWHVQPETYKILYQDHDIVQSIAEARALSPFPANHQFQRLDILFEDQMYLTRINDTYTCYKHWQETTHPKFTEFRLDGDCALFSVQGEVLVDRIYLIAQSHSYLKGNGFIPLKTIHSSGISAFL